MDEIHRWGRFDVSLRSDTEYAEPTHDLELHAEFVAPSGARHVVRGFWDGDRTWRLRMSPDEVGSWTYTASSRPTDPGLDGVTGRFECVAYDGPNPLFRRGAVRVADGGRHLAHADGTPFFYLADTAWNGPMKSTDADWESYLTDRVGKKFTAVQYLSTPFRACATTANGHPAYVGKERIRIVPEYFQWLDPRVDAINDHGLLAVPLLLHAGADTTLNPAHHLPTDQAIVLARYLVARYGAHHVLWDFIAEARYHGDNAEIWRHVGRSVFDFERRQPVTLHPHSLDWVLDEFADETWMDVVGYQSGHGGDEKSWRWIVEGPPSTDWQKSPARPFVNLEPPYEGFASYSEHRPLDVKEMRRACYWSLLVAPPAGVAYGAHGVWGWDDGSGPTMGHPHAGTPRPWWEALDLPGVASMTRIAELMATIDWWRLRPYPDLVVEQPGRRDVELTVVAARTEDGSFAVVYVPAGRTVRLAGGALPAGPVATWFDPRTGERGPAQGTRVDDVWEVATPGDDDWVLLVSSSRT